MSSPAIALLWESWRRSYRQQLTQLVLVLLLCSLWISFAIEQASPAVQSDWVMAIVLTSNFILLVTTPASSGDGSGNFGFSFKLAFMRPVPSWLLATIPMLYFLVMVVAAYLIPALILKLLFDLPLPFMLPTLIIAVFVLYALATNWWATSLPRYSIGVAIPLLLAGLCVLGKRDMLGTDFPAAGWSTTLTISATGIIGLIVLAVICVSVIIRSVARQRYDDIPGSNGKLLIRKVLYRNCPVTSPQHAEIWKLLGNSVEHSILFGLLLAGWVAVIIKSVSDGTVAETDDALSMVPLMFLGLIFFSSQRTNGIEFRRGVGTASIFDRTLALGTAQLTWLKFKASVILLTCTGIVYLLTLLVLWALLFQKFDSENLSRWPAVASTVAAIASASAIEIIALIGVAIVQLATMLLLLSVATIGLSFWGNRIAAVIAGLIFYVIALYWLVWQFATAAAQHATMLLLFQIHFWIVDLVLAGVMIYLANSLLSDRIFNESQLLNTTAIWCLFALMYFSVLYSLGFFTNADYGTPGGLILTAALLPLLAVLLAPWIQGAFVIHESDKHI